VESRPAGSSARIVEVLLHPDLVFGAEPPISFFGRVFTRSITLFRRLSSKSACAIASAVAPVSWKLPNNESKASLGLTIGSTPTTPPLPSLFHEILPVMPPPPLEPT
jgi:hypothetical protein